MTSYLHFVWGVIPDLLIVVGVYHIARWLYNHQRQQKPQLPQPWRIYVKPFSEHFYRTDYGRYGKRSDAGVEIGISNGKTRLKVGEALMESPSFEKEMAKLQEAAESRLHILELEATE